MTSIATKNTLIEALTVIAHDIDHGTSDSVRELADRLQREVDDKNSLSITAEEVRKVRAATGCGMFAAKKAVYDANGHIGTAIILARSRL